MSDEACDCAAFGWAVGEGDGGGEGVGGAVGVVEGHMEKL